jgi:malonyl-CoA O-methyltransferase
MNDAYALDADRVRRSFHRAADRYDQVAVLQREVGRRLLERYDFVTLDPPSILDLGCGTGDALAPLFARYRQADLIAVDFAQGMLDRAPDRVGGPLWWGRPVRRICADAARIPLEDASVGLVHSNLMLQWCDDLVAVFTEVRRVLRPGGLFSFTCFGPDTLKELRAAWAEVDAAAHVNRFPDMHDIGDALVHAGLAEPVLDVEQITVRHATVRELMRDLKGLGAHNANRGRPRGLTGRAQLATLERAYETERRDGTLPATYEIIYGHCWGAAPAQRASDDGSVAVPISAIGRRDR